MNPTPLTNKSEISVALVGNPNAGKSSIFNHLTGLNQKVGNFPGVTVDKKTGSLTLSNSQKVKVIDLPGTYSFYPNSLDEKIALQVLADRQNELAPDLVVYVADITNLERHLLLLTQIMDLGIPAILVLNMLDIAQKEGIDWDKAELQKQLGVEVFEVNGRTGKGLDQVKKSIEQFQQIEVIPFYDIDSLADNRLISALKETLQTDNLYQALLSAHHFQDFPHLNASQKEVIQKVLDEHQFSSIRLQVDETMGRYDKIVPLVQKVVHQRKENEETVTEKIDNILTHPFYGLVVFLGILFFVFQAIFAWANYPMDMIDEGFAQLGSYLQSVLPSGMLTNLLTDGILAGLGGVLIFIPQITILFCLIALLEDVGYMSRAVFMSDGLMRKFGLNGRSIVSLISGVACAIPAIMSTRTISNWKERLITIFVTPLISCSARIPIFTVLIAFVVPQKSWGIFNLQGLVMLGLYVGGVGAALFSAYVLKLILKTKERQIFVMELPSYKMPHWKVIGFTVVEKVKVFVLEAGKIIMIISVVLWFLASFGPPSQMDAVEEQVRTQYQDQNLSEAEIENLIAGQKIEVSYAGYLGKTIEPLIAPLGFDWKMGIALITSFAAREVFVGTMATIYKVGSSEDEQTIIEQMKQEKRAKTGLPVYDLATSLSLLIFYLFAMQCMSTLAVVYRETKGWKWPLIQLFYMTGLAYLSSLLVYSVLG